MPAALRYQVDRTVTIQADREIVFAFFTDSARWASWWGAGSTIDARPGGDVRIRYPDGTEASGTIVDLQPPERIVFTYGYASGRLIAPGASTVTIQLEAADRGTRLRLTHAVADEATRDAHVQGWRYQLSLFSNVVADALNGSASDLVDAWFDAWADADVARRQRTLDRIAAADVSFHDRFGNTDGIADLMPHITAAQHFMPGMRMQRAGSVRHCQGTVLAEWIAHGPDGQERARGANVFALGPDGRIRSVTGFMAPTNAAQSGGPT
jgi:uncharacterized protein YndB with AHSA1/START domain